MIAWVAIVALVIAGVALVAGQGDALGGYDVEKIAVSMALGAAVLFLLTQAAGRFGGLVRDLVVWTGLALILIAGYGYREELSAVWARVAGELAPVGESITMSDRPGERAVRIRRARGEHFQARTSIDGVTVDMLVDTGASTVVLTQNDARRIGLKPDRLNYSVQVRTANGVAMAAPVRLRRIAIGPIHFESLEALVAKPGALSQSLLGMNFLSRLRSYEFSGEFLTLRG